MRVLVCGGRDYFDWNHFKSTMNCLDLELGPFDSIIHGCAPGADTMGGYWARILGKKEVWFPADWKTYGKAAGSIRNQKMLDEGKPDLVIAFPGGPGTADMIRRSRRVGVKVLEVKPRCL